MHLIEKTLLINPNKVNRQFFIRPALEVSRDILGKIICFNEHMGIILEAEAYGGSDDPASHAFRGATKRSKIMFETAGFSYVYLCYGIHYCLNFTTDTVGTPGAVLIRSLQIIKPSLNITALNGPGRVCKALNITTQHTGLDVVKEKNFFIAQGIEIVNFICTPRIGISTGKDKMWRFKCDPIENNNITVS